MVNKWSLNFSHKKIGTANFTVPLPQNLMTNNIKIQLNNKSIFKQDIYIICSCITNTNNGYNIIFNLIKHYVIR